MQNNEAITSSRENSVPPRTHSVRQRNIQRQPWHVDYMHMRELVRGIALSSTYAHGRLLDVGCGGRPYENLFPNIDTYIGIDVNHQTGNPTVGSLAYPLPFASACFDTVLSNQTLEHVEEPHTAVQEMARVLKPGGHLILTAPQTWRLHEQPYDFYRYTRYGLQYLLEENHLHVREIVAQGGVWMTVGQIINNTVHHWLRPRLHIYATYLIYLTNNLVFDTLDRLWIDTDETINYLAIAQKRDSS
ncbi:MAG: class I SAM-dependent methyltransferase [Chloroflexota bacterium]